MIYILEWLAYSIGTFVVISHSCEAGPFAIHATDVKHYFIHRTPPIQTKIHHRDITINNILHWTPMT